MQADGLFSSAELAKTAAILLKTSSAVASSKNFSSSHRIIEESSNDSHWPNASYPKLGNAINNLSSSANTNHSSQNYIYLSASNTPTSFFSSQNSTPSPRTGCFGEHRPFTSFKNAKHLPAHTHPQLLQLQHPQQSKPPTSLMLMDKLLSPIGSVHATNNTHKLPTLPNLNSHPHISKAYSGI